MKRHALDTETASLPLPVDVVLIIFKRIYLDFNHQAHYTYEMQTLLDMRTLSSWFRDSINALVGGLTRLNVNLSRKLTDEILYLFTGLHHLRMDKLPNEAPVMAYDLGRLKHLRTLDLGPACHLDPSPDIDCATLTSMQRLHTLKLGAGQLSQCHILAQLTSLTSLSLDRRQFDKTRFVGERKQIEFLGTLTQLRHLAIGQLYTEVCAKEVVKLTGLTALDLEWTRNYVGDQTLIHLTGLRLLRLGRHNATTDDTLQRLTTLEALVLPPLDLSDMNISARSLRHLTNLKYLGLRNKANGLLDHYDAWLPHLTHLAQLSTPLKYLPNPFFHYLVNSNIYIVQPDWSCDSVFDEVWPKEAVDC